MTLRVLGIAIVIQSASLASARAQADAPLRIAPARTDHDGLLVHDVESPYQKGVTAIRVLLPELRRPEEQFSVVYVLPVEAGGQSRFGDGLLEVKAQQLHNRRRLLFVAPTFAQLPWYADHADDPGIRQESYLLHVVLPFVETTYPVRRKRDDQLLLGFSKSGWGAWALLLRHPDRFGRAAAWDAPLMMDQLGKYGTTPIFGTPENFERYRLTDLVREKGLALEPANRLILTGYGNFRQDHERMHSLLLELGIPHVYRDGPQRKHDWHSGWVAEAVELLATSPQNR
jgi:S-formylglutathione hydrolase FrmB